MVSALRTRSAVRDPITLLDTSVELADARRHVCAQFHNDQLELTIEDFGHARLDASGIVRMDCQESIDPVLLNTVLFGPLLLPVLSYSGQYCLHASAIESPHGVIAFCGHSGAGKSTMARLLRQRGWQRVADDQLMIVSDDGHIAPFPQYKTPGSSDATTRSLRAIIELTPSPKTAYKLNAVGRAQTAILLAQHTCAVDLFPPAQRQQHTRWAATLGSKLHCRRLSFEHNLQGIDDLIDALDRDCKHMLAC
ncbi:MAG: hypothetical protein DHS20C11_38350 [Lysobacteraceae bacterium]|nr:MAG: hypothetical protein DHS20C11_38350 [Xanthomonadaceae bacterium]